MPVSTVFLFINFSCKGSFFFGQSLKHLSADCPRCEHRCFYTATSNQTCSVLTRTPRMPWRTSHRAKEFSRSTLCAACKNRDTKLRTPIFTCHNLTCKPQQTQACARHEAIFQWYASEPTQDKLNQYKIVDVIAAGACGVSNSRLYTYNISPQI